MDIVVLAGGISTERDVSLISGQMIYEALRTKGHRVILLDVYLGYAKENYREVFELDEDWTKEIHGIGVENPDIEAVKALRPDGKRNFFGPHVTEICQNADMVFLALHGENGENGKIQAAFDLLGIRYTGTDYMSSALAMDKQLSKELFWQNDVPTPEGFCIETAKALECNPSYPAVVKVCCGGSSVGVYMVHDRAEYEAAVQDALQYDSRILVEKCIEGREFSVGVVDGRALPVIEIAPIEGFYDYKNKYQSGSTIETCPAKISESARQKMQDAAEKVWNVLRFSSYARMDFMMDADENIYCLEANTLPGMTPTSLLPQEAAAEGTDFAELCETLLQVSLAKYEDEKTMPGMTPEKIAEVCGGHYTGEEAVSKQEITGAVLDSRQVEAGFLFVATKGERVDGHTFIDTAYEKGALCVLGEKPPKDGRPYIQVKDSFQALKQMAEYYRQKLSVTVVGITGSVGKTSTKECIAAVLEQKYKVLKTQGNFNNEVGLPLTILRLRRQHEVAVLEMGISDFGEMHRLSQMARPDICVMTNIGQCHLENLHDRAGILRAKSEIFDFMNPSGTIVANGDDDMLRTVADTYKKQTLLFGKGSQDIYADEIQDLGLLGSRASVHTPKGDFEAQIPLPGVHMVYNALAATAVGEVLQVSIQQIKEGLMQVKALGGRGRIARISKTNLTLIDDCYNANPVSMRAALDLLTTAKGHRTAILGDMFELGEKEAELHAQVGAYGVEKGVERICFIGTLAKHMYEAAKQELWEHPDRVGATQIEYYATRESFEEEMSQKPLQNSTVLIKASHGMQFAKLVSLIEG